jgi:glycosyltransferase involved in cell wall biosynthesis
LLGDGTELNRLKAVVSDDDLNAEILGWSENTSEWISGAKFLLIPSLSEGFPNVVLESLQVNTPVISTPNSQIVKDLSKLGYCELTCGFNQADIEKSIAKILNGKDQVFQSKFEQLEFMSQFGSKHVVSTLINRMKH